MRTQGASTRTSMKRTDAATKREVRQNLAFAVDDVSGATTCRRHRWQRCRSSAERSPAMPSGIPAAEDLQERIVIAQREVEKGRHRRRGMAETEQQEDREHRRMRAWSRDQACA